jgi:hypothetical protein
MMWQNSTTTGRKRRVFFHSHDLHLVTDQVTDSTKARYYIKIKVTSLITIEPDKI